MLSPLKDNRRNLPYAIARMPDQEGCLLDLSCSRLSYAVLSLPACCSQYGQDLQPKNTQGLANQFFGSASDPEFFNFPPSLAACHSCYLILYRKAYVNLEHDQTERCTVQDFTKVKEEKGN